MLPIALPMLAVLFLISGWRMKGFWKSALNFFCFSLLFFILAFNNLNILNGQTNFNLLRIKDFDLSSKLADVFLIETAFILKYLVFAAFLCAFVWSALSFLIVAFAERKPTIINANSFSGRLFKQVQPVFCFVKPNEKQTK